MNSQTKIMPMEAAAVISTLKERLFKVCYLAAIAIATVGWLSGLGWAAVEAAKWLFA
jgi:hypothetical protein